MTLTAATASATRVSGHIGLFSLHGRHVALRDDDATTRPLSTCSLKTPNVPFLCSTHQLFLDTPLVSLHRNPVNRVARTAGLYDGAPSPLCKTTLSSSASAPDTCRLSARRTRALLSAPYVAGWLSCEPQLDTKSSEMTAAMGRACFE